MIEISRNPMPGGGFVATFTDVTRVSTHRRRAQGDQRNPGTAGGCTDHRTGAGEAGMPSGPVEARPAFWQRSAMTLVQPAQCGPVADPLAVWPIGRQTQRANRSSRFPARWRPPKTCLKACWISRAWTPAVLEPRLTRFPLAELFEQLAGEFRA